MRRPYRYARAVDIFEKVLSDHPDANFLDVILYNYGRCLFRMDRKAGKYEEQGSEPDHAAIFAQKFTCGQAKVAGALEHPGTKVTAAGVQQPRQALSLKGMSDFKRVAAVIEPGPGPRQSLTKAFNAW